MASRSQILDAVEVLAAQAAGDPELAQALTSLVTRFRGTEPPTPNTLDETGETGESATKVSPAPTPAPIPETVTEPVAAASADATRVDEVIAEMVDTMAQRHAAQAAADPTEAPTDAPTDAPIEAPTGVDVEASDEDPFADLVAALAATPGEDLAGNAVENAPEDPFAGMRAAVNDAVLDQVLPTSLTLHIAGRDGFVPSAEQIAQVAEQAQRMILAEVMAGAEDRRAQVIASYENYVELARQAGETEVEEHTAEIIDTIRNHQVLPPELELGDVTEGPGGGSVQLVAGNQDTRQLLHLMGGGREGFNAIVPIGERLVSVTATVDPVADAEAADELGLGAVELPEVPEGQHPINGAVAMYREATGEDLRATSMKLTFARADGQQLTEEQVREILDAPITRMGLARFGQHQLFAITAADDGAAMTAELWLTDTEGGDIDPATLALAATHYGGSWEFPGIGAVRMTSQVSTNIDPLDN